VTPLLNFGDLVIVNRTYHGILLSDADPDDDAVAVAVGNGTEEMVAPRLIVPVPLRPGSPGHANFAEWTHPMALPLDRAVNSFMGEFTERDSPGHQLGILALFLELARVVIGLPPAAFGHSSRREYLGSVIRTLEAPW
jgi:hypothetical protein